MFTGGFEFVFILFIAFLLFGPKKLPEIARVLGKGLGELRRASNELKFSLEEEIRNLERESQNQKQLEAPAYTRERQETVLDIPATQDATEEAAPGPGRQLAVSTGELTATVTDNGNHHRDGTLQEPDARS